MARKTSALPTGLTFSPVGSRPEEGFFCRARFLVPSKVAEAAGVAVWETTVITFPYTGLHTDAALEATRQAWNQLPLDGSNQRARFAKFHGVVPHLSNLSLCDRPGRYLRTVTGPTFEVVA